MSLCLGDDMTHAYVYTEGKTDRQHIIKALEKLKINISIEFPVIPEKEDGGGDSDLLKMCEMYSRHPNSIPLVFIFDRDNSSILHKITQEGETFKDWKNNVYSFAIPIPNHRQGYENVCIEMYYTDEEIKTKDGNGRRLYLTSEFDKETCL
jgi:RNA-directed DNA polymerase